MPLTIKAINAELEKRGHDAQLEKAGDYFYFLAGETTDWLDRTVRVPKVSSLTLDQWVEEFEKLKNRNADIFGAAKGKEVRSKKRSTKL
jgi:hypothetical protein